MTVKLPSVALPPPSVALNPPLAALHRAWLDCPASDLFAVSDGLTLGSVMALWAFSGALRRPCGRTGARLLSTAVLRDAASVGAVSVRGLEDVAATPPNSDAWLSRLPRGAYTNARTFQRHSVLELDLHVRRLAESVRLMLAEEEGAPAPPEVWELTHPEAMRACLLPCVRRALLLHREAFPAYEAELKLCCLVTWSEGAPVLHAHAAPCAAGPRRPSRRRSPGRRARTRRRRIRHGSQSASDWKRYMYW